MMLDHYQQTKNLLVSYSNKAPIGFGSSTARKESKSGGRPRRGH